jgi:hypothetical protein
MDFNATIDLIIKDLEEAREIIDDLKKYPGVPFLQVELAKSKCRSAGEVIALLKHSNDNIVETKEEMTGPTVHKHIQLQEEKKTSIRTGNFIPQTEEKNIIAIPVEIHPLSVENKEELEKIPENTSDSSILADKFSHLSNRFNEQLGNLKGEEDVTEILKTMPLTNLSEAIGVNDKFMFIREIFHGDKDAYNEVISQLDNAESLSGARAVLMSYTGNNIENDAVKQLLDLVKRKHSSNE